MHQNKRYHQFHQSKNKAFTQGKDLISFHYYQSNFHIKKFYENLPKKSNLLHIYVTILMNIKANPINKNGNLIQFSQT